MRRLVLLLAGSILLVAGPVRAADPSRASLTIRAVAPGDPVGIEFRSLGLSPDAFVVADGAERVFRNLKPGRYVVVQAPPRDGWSLRMQCSDGESTNEYHLTDEHLVCTFTSERL
jgi:hypothetical protein